MVFRVCLIEPTFQTCGGNHRTEDRAAKRYNHYPVGILITEKEKDFRNLKCGNKKFFKQLRQKPKKYCIWPGHSNGEQWEYETFAEAQARLEYEAKGCGHYVRVASGRWEVKEKHAAELHEIATHEIALLQQQKKDLLAIFEKNELLLVKQELEKTGSVFAVKVAR